MMHSEHIIAIVYNVMEIRMEALVHFTSESLLRPETL